jgi:O-antigen ligase
MVDQFPSREVAAAGRDLMRAFGVFPDPHMLSFFLGMILPFPLAYFLLVKKRQLSLFMVAAFLFLVLLLTFSRGGYLGVLAALAAMLILGWRFFDSGRKLKIAAAGFLILFVLLVFAQPVLDRFFSSFFLSEGSSIGRLAIWQRSWQVFLEHPFLGVGLGNFSKEFDPLATYRNPITSHNLYLDILTETGLFGLLVWILLLAGSFYQVWKFVKKNKELPFLALGLFGSLAYFSIHSVFESAVFNPIIISFFLMILALVNNLKNYEHSA